MIYVQQLNTYLLWCSAFSGCGSADQCFSHKRSKSSNKTGPAMAMWNVKRLQRIHPIKSHDFLMISPWKFPFQIIISMPKISWKYHIFVSWEYHVHHDIYCGYSITISQTAKPFQNSTWEPRFRSLAMPGHPTQVRCCWSLWMRMAGAHWPTSKARADVIWTMKFKISVYIYIIIHIDNIYIGVS